MGTKLPLLRSLHQHFQHLYSGLRNRQNCSNPALHDSKILLKTLDMHDELGNVRMHLLLDACSDHKPIEVRIADDVPMLKPNNISEPLHDSLLELRQQVQDRAVPNPSKSLTTRLVKKIYGSKGAGTSALKSAKGTGTTQYVFSSCICTLLKSTGMLFRLQSQKRLSNSHRQPPLKVTEDNHLKILYRQQRLKTFARRFQNGTPRPGVWGLCRL
jgi:hypothetical protein